jgi:hypothetical protein
MSLKIRRGTDAERLTITPDEGELIYTTDGKSLYVGDGTTVGGNIIHGIGYTGSVGAGYTGSRGSVISAPLGGTLTSNLNTSTHNITNGSTLIIDGSTGSLKAGGLILYNSQITSTSYFISDNRNPIGKITINDRTQLILQNSDTSVPSITQYFISNGTLSGYNDTNTSRGTITVPTSITPGDKLSSLRANAYDGTNFVLSSAIQFTVDETSTVSTGHVSGKILFQNLIDNNPNNAKTMVWDSKGRLGVNKLVPTETLDVTGTGKFSGYVIFGSYSTTDRDMLTAQKGMIIYNTTTDRFQGYQSNSWINLDDGTAA